MVEDSGRQVSIMANNDSIMANMAKKESIMAIWPIMARIDPIDSHKPLIY